MQNILVAAVLALSTTAASAAAIDFDATNVGPGHDAYAAGFTQYNAGTAAPATVAGVAFGGTSGVDFGAFGFAGNATQTAFLQSYPGLTDGSFTLTSLGLTAATRYVVSFDDALRNAPFAFTVSQGATLLGTFTPAGSSALLPQGFSFVSTGTDGLTFAAVNGGGADVSAAIDNIVVAVPEPSTWAMLLAGFGLVGFATRRRNRAVAA